jgi:hypothetical protein
MRRLSTLPSPNIKHFRSFDLKQVLRLLIIGMYDPLTERVPALSKVFRRFIPQIDVHTAMLNAPFRESTPTKQGHVVVAY